MRSLGATRNTLRFGGHEVDARVVLAVATVGALALDLWAGHGTSFSTDEIDWFAATPGLDVRHALAPYNGHLILGTRLAYDLLFHVFGVAYLPFRVLGLVSAIATSWLLFVFTARRVGRTVALAPSLILLVYGSDTNHLLLGNSIQDLTPLWLGIGSLLALERDDRLGDVIACALLLAAVATYSTGLAFVGGVAVLTIAERERWRRAWVVVVPVVLYAAWFVWSHGQPASTSDNVKVSNLLLAPAWIADSLGNVTAAITGLGYGAFSTNWAPLAGIGAFVLVVVALRRRVSPWALATLAIPLTFWTLGAAAAVPPSRVPEAGRYIFPGTVCLLLFAAEGARGLRFRGPWLAGLAVVVVLSLATNLELLKEGSGALRAVGTVTRYDLSAVQAANGSVVNGAPGSVLPIPADPGRLLWTVLNLTGHDGVATGYLEAVAEFGSPAYSENELAALPEADRAGADAALAQTLGVRTQAATAARGCTVLHAQAGTPIVAKLPPGGVTLLSPNGVNVSVRRFAKLIPTPVGHLAAGSPAALIVPRDPLQTPWYVTASTPSLSLCRLGAA